MLGINDEGASIRTQQLRTHSHIPTELDFAEGTCYSGLCIMLILQLNLYL